MSSEVESRINSLKTSDFGNQDTYSVLLNKQFPENLCHVFLAKQDFPEFRRPRITKFYTLKV